MRRGRAPLERAMGRVRCGPEARPVRRLHYRRLAEEGGGASECRVPPHHPPGAALLRRKDYFSYSCCQCGHRQKVQAEELNSVVGNAFRMAYASQLHRRPAPPDSRSSPPGPPGSLASSPPPYPPTTTAPSPAAPPPLPPETRRNQLNQQRHASDDTNNNSRGGNNNGDLGLHGWSNTHRWIAAGQASRPLNWVKHNPPPVVEMNVQIGESPTCARPPKPSSIPGLQCEGSDPPPESVAPDGAHVRVATPSPSSDESNSPTEMNSYKRMAEKPALIKRLAMMGVGCGPKGDEGAPLVSSGSPTSVCQPAGSVARGPQRRPLSGGYVNEAASSADGDEVSARKATLKTMPDSRHITSRSSKTEPKRFSHEASAAFFNPNSKKHGPIHSSSPRQVSCGVSAVPAPAGGVAGDPVAATSVPPPLPPERSDSLGGERGGEEGELRAAPWFQAGIPREITLEVLGQEPEGAFMVRESTSKAGCYALSLRVPKDFQQSGIAHYLIMRTNKGYKIKGFTKEFSSLTSLITHHSVMPELLPCPLSLSRYNPSFLNSDSSRDFADIDSDPDYNTLADFRKMMADLNV